MDLIAATAAEEFLTARGTTTPVWRPNAWHTRSASLKMTSLPALVRGHEPHSAPQGDEDGLDFHRYLRSEGLQFLSPGGTLAV